MVKCSSKKKEKEKKNTWKKIYFCTKVILSLACVLCSFPLFLLRAVVYVVEKLIQRGNFQIENFKLRGIVGFGTSVTVSPFYFAIFQPVAAMMGMSSFIIFLSIFKRRWNFVICSLWVAL